MKISVKMWLSVTWYIVSAADIISDSLLVSRKFPSLYYPVKYELDDGTTVDFVMIDTVTLCGNVKDIENSGFIEYFLTEAHESLHGPDDIQAANTQQQWIEQQLRSSTANYLFVAGHFPVYSIASHGPTACLVERLQPLLSTYNVSAYLSGHDHNLQHLKYTENGWTTHYMVSGMAAYSDSSKKHEEDVPAGSLQFHFPEKGNWFTKFFTDGGYVFGEIFSTSANFTFLDGKNKVLNVFALSPRNK